ncbi:DKNYY domain-containing protein [Spirosoma fluminis]
MGITLGRATRWRIIPDEDVKTFKGVGTYYARDKCRVYFGSESISGVDPATFEETGYLQAKDKNRTYQSGQMVPN